MIVDPLSKDKASRYPDETISPTGLVHLATQVTYNVDPSGTLFSVLSWKCDQVGVSNVIVPPAPIGVGAPPMDYGAPQATWAALSAVDRTLACGIRVRVVGLPVSTFLPAGTLYFIQFQNSEWPALPLTEAAAIQAVTAGKGFTATVNELSKTDGLTLPFLPQGPMSFVFSDTNALAPATAGRGGGPPSEVVSANGGLMVVGFGMQPGQVLRFDYAHHIEYIPRATAAGLIATATEPPSAGARDAISRGAQAVQSTIGGATSARAVSGLLSGGGSGAVATLGRVAVGLIPGAAAGLALAKSAGEALGAPSWMQSLMHSMSP